MAGGGDREKVDLPRNYSGLAYRTEKKDHEVRLNNTGIIIGFALWNLGMYIVISREGNFLNLESEDCRLAQKVR